MPLILPGPTRAARHDYWHPSSVDLFVETSGDGGRPTGRFLAVREGGAEGIDEHLSPKYVGIGV